MLRISLSDNIFRLQVKLHIVYLKSK